MEQVAQDTQPTTKVKMRLQESLDRAQKLVEKRKAALQDIEARERTKADKTPSSVITRRKILIGAYMLETKPQIVRTAEFVAWLKRDGDRAVFGLEPVSQESTS